MGKNSLESVIRHFEGQTYSSLEDILLLGRSSSVSMPRCFLASFSRYFLVSFDKVASTAIPRSRVTKRVSLGRNSLVSLLPDNED